MEITILEKNIMDKIAILIPCYNEEKTIEKVVKDWKKELPDAVVYVYDNNSTDRTVELAKKAGAVVRYEYSQGKGNVIRRMFREINAECYIMVVTGRMPSSLPAGCWSITARTCRLSPGIPWPAPGWAGWQGSMRG